jgi:predicted permease
VSQLLAGSPEGLHYDTTLDLKVLGFAIAVTLSTVLLAGLFPALKSGGVSPNHGLRDRTSIGAPRLRAGRLLVGAQIALSLLLVTGAGLYARTLVNLLDIDPGFAMDHMLLLNLSPGDAGYDYPRSVTYFEEVERSLSAIPGVQSTTLTNISLLGGALEVASLEIPDHPEEKGPSYTGANVLAVGDEFLKTMGIPLLAGRELRVSDGMSSAKVIVVNEAFVRKFFPSELPLGRTVSIAGSLWQIVGMCRDAKYNSIKDKVGPTVYFSFRQSLHDNATIALRTVLPPRSLTATVRNAIAAIDTNVPVSSIITEEELRNSSIAPEKMFAECCGALALLALLLSAIGLYGLMAYEMTRRTSEFGIRMALGATPRQVLGPIVGKALFLSSTGILIGVPLAMGLTRLIRSNLYGVTPSDPATFLAASALLFTVMLFAAWIPARRATRVDPMVALRCD